MYNTSKGVIIVDIINFILMILSSLFASFFLVALGLSAWSIVSVRIKGKKVIEKELAEYELLENEDQETFNRLERYKDIRFFSIVIIVALFLIILFYALSV